MKTTRKKALFWSVPDDVLEDPAFTSWRIKTVLCEGLAEDVELLDKNQIEKVLTQRFLPLKIKRIWTEYFQDEAQIRDKKMKLTALQKKVIKIFSQADKNKDFYFTGGTALAVCYLSHRKSEDIDLFTGNPVAVAPTAREFESRLKKAGLGVEVERRQSSFVRILVKQELKVDLALDTPFRLKPPVRLSLEGINFLVDDLTDVAANKMLALFGRAEPRDFIDVYFLSKEYFDFMEMVEMAGKKDTGFDLYWLAAALLEVDKIKVLPVKMCKPFDLTDMKQFFKEQRLKLMRRIVKT
ncbi:nucleotidyl transferase AbiEii/AbiGii toxin family protein [Pelotomaculum propionicicum]|uniref:Nucleotidyl transferase AbiEii/AbiGii toxin family protein n=1 Tax=Pelotomaculum propionicicum TaxID=258475 RepID=A0A4Y7RWX8_9FIRM|nr:nucleotidyl transferase AbiEii/AbiGii toxin family protein [Pelotomaculum propionicicum]NLI12417.1 nucleotidyl transferase AbiEii/AbiGii toxin family protein [Peptococcaceae bacterium]TEB13226.1 hypothetical protein Pmgp_00522 [Pelotomaculum propionicicum]